jgi:curli production assembly/transport component CsgG
LRLAPGDQAGLFMQALSQIRGCRLAAAVWSALALTGCESIAKRQLSEGLMPPIVAPITELNMSLRTLPPPDRKVVVAVYNYADQTGQFKPTENVQSLSKAVTQGATSVIIKALQDTGNGSWFTVVEREKLDNLLKERRIIAEMRKTYLGEDNVNPQALPPLLFAGLLLEGGIIGYDSNIQTGGIGAALLGIGGDVKYRLDTITVYLRAVSTKNGQVMSSVVTHKTLASVGVHGGVFKYISVDRILEGEVGFTKNEPEQLAVQQAIEKAVYSLVVEGSEQGLWAFHDKDFQSRAIDDYRSQQFSTSEQAALRAGKTSVAQASAAQTVTPAPGNNGQKASGGSAVAAAPRPAQPQPQGRAVAQGASAPPAPPKAQPSASSGSGPAVSGFTTMIAPAATKKAELDTKDASN